jgi:prolyl oligopeptidase
MKKSLILFLSAFSIMQAQKIQYPSTKKVNHTDTYFGTEINDTYRWLEDDRSAETEAWVKEQNKNTYSYVDNIPYRQAIKDRMTSLLNYEKIGAPFIEGDFTYFYKNDGLQNQYILYRKDKKGKVEIFLDPNTFSADGSSSLAGISFSKDGSLVAYQISEAGSDWTKAIILNAVTKEKIGETITDIKFSGISWYKNDGFYYSSYDKPEGSELSAKTDQHKVYYHKLGTSQKDDKVIFGADVKKRYVGGGVTEDEKFLVISAANATYGSELYFKDLSNPNSAIIAIIDNMNNDYSYVANKESVFYLQTDKDAPNNKLITLDVKNLKASWKTIIKETDNVLSVSSGGGYLFANYTKDAISFVQQYDMQGKLVRDIKLPGIGTVGGFGGKKDEKIFYYSFSNYTTPGSIYIYDIAKGTSKLYQKSKINFNSDLYESKQVFYTSKDGAKIPMIISYKKGLKLNSKTPTLLYGYGGFNVSLTPGFSATRAVWMENGGIYAVANLRGGGEYGKKWHEAGIQMKKQNVFDDFIAAAEYLIKEKYTSSDFLAIEGGSNGGLLVGATMLQRPELFKVAIPEVGVLDMLRYHTFTAGAGWAYDYGTAEQSKEMFEYLRKYSPVHNVKSGVNYPATMVTTGDHDDRVVPAHSFKFASELQDKYKGENPMLIRIDVNAGHGAGKSLTSSINESADIQSFILYNMGIKELKK